MSKLGLQYVELHGHCLADLIVLMKQDYVTLAEQYTIVVTAKM